MKVLVVGGAGYIGSHVVRTLLDKNHAVTVFDNMSTGRSENIFAGTTFVKGDILNTGALNAVCAAKFDALIHLAALKAAGESMVSPEKYSVNNLCGTINVLNAAAQNSIGAIVFSSTAAVYGEPQYCPVDEEHPQVPANYYGFTKLEIERLLSWYHKLRGINYAALRYFNAAGYDVDGRVRGLEQNPQNLLPIIMEAATGVRPILSIYGTDYNTPDGSCIRDYVHVNDLADAHVAALEYITTTKTNLTVNLGSGSGISVLEMVDIARKITGKPIPATVVGRRPGDPAKLIASSGKARQLLGWKARQSDVETLVASTWKMYS